MVTAILSKNTPMISRLSLKLSLASFCGCIIFTLIILTYIGRFSTPFTVSIIDRVFSFGYLSAGISIYHSEGEKGVEHWIKYLKKTEHIEAYFMVKNKRIIGEKPYPNPIQVIYHKFNTQRLPLKVSKVDWYVISGEKSQYSFDENYRLIVNSKTVAQGMPSIMIVAIELFLALCFF